MKNDNRDEEIVRDIMELKREVDRISKLVPLYSILNPEVVVDLTSNQNNFALPNVDLIRPNPTANRTINGFANGVNGRLLFVYNQSASFTISFTHQSASATLGNRIVTPTSGTIVLGTRKTALFMYEYSLAWLMFFPAA
jgi:hypothetical protein